MKMFCVVVRGFYVSVRKFCVEAGIICEFCNFSKVCADVFRVPTHHHAPNMEQLFDYMRAAHARLNIKNGFLSEKNVRALVRNADSM